MFFPSCGIPVLEQKGTSVREIAGGVCGLTDKCPRSPFWSVPLRDGRTGSAGGRQAVKPTPPQLILQPAPLPRCRIHLYSSKKSTCRLLPLAWAWTASTKMGIHIPTHQLKTTAAFSEVLVGNQRWGERITDPRTSTWAKSNREA